MTIENRNYVVFVDEQLIQGSVSMMAASEGGQGGSMYMERARNLGFRRQALAGLASDLLRSPGESNARATRHAATAMSETLGGKSTQTVNTFDDSTSTQILEGIGAIVVSDDELDINSLKGVVGLAVYRNFDITLTEPERGSVSDGPNFWHLDRVGADQSVSNAGEGVLIGILDTGIDSSHPEFAGKSIHFAEFDSVGRRISTKSRDAGDHGTHVSSLAAGKTAGVAKGADLAVAAVLTHENLLGQMTGTLIQIANGFDWLVKTPFREGDAGVDIVNASLGVRGFNSFLQVAVRNARSVGVPLIAAMGNAGRNGEGHHDSPGNYPEAMGVGASDIQDVVAEFSDWGTGAPPTGPSYPVPALCAPGVNIWGAIPGGGFEQKSGTSMATPIVTGVAATRMSSNAALRNNPSGLFFSLNSALATVYPHSGGNLGGAGRIRG